MKAIVNLYLAQAKTFLRDRSSGFFVLLLPVAFGVFFGLVFGGSGGDFTLRLGIANQDLGATGASLLASLTENPAIDLLEGNAEELKAQLEKGDLDIVLVLPAALSTTLSEKTSIGITVFFDSSRQSSANIGMSMIQTLFNEANFSLSGASRLLQIDAQAVQTNPLRPIDFYLPGMLGVALLWLGVFGTAQPFMAQREAQILRRLSVAPISRSSMLVAEVAWRVSIGLMQTMIFLIVGFIGFRVGVKDWPIFSGTVLTGTLVFVCMGYVIAGVARTQEAGAAIGQLIQFPMMMLSGSIFSADFLPAFFKPIVAFIPLTYLSDLLRQSMSGMTPSYSLAVNFSVLGAWFIILALLAARLWRWE